MPIDRILREAEKLSVPEGGSVPLPQRLRRMIGDLNIPYTVGEVVNIGGRKEIHLLVDIYHVGSDRVPRAACTLKLFLRRGRKRPETGIRAEFVSTWEAANDWDVQTGSRMDILSRSLERAIRKSARELGLPYPSVRVYRNTVQDLLEGHLCFPLELRSVLKKLPHIKTLASLLLHREPHVPSVLLQDVKNFAHLMRVLREAHEDGITFFAAGDAVPPHVRELLVSRARALGLDVRRIRDTYVARDPYFGPRVEYVFSHPFGKALYIERPGRRSVGLVLYTRRPHPRLPSARVGRFYVVRAEKEVESAKDFQRALTELFERFFGKTAPGDLV